MHKRIVLRKEAAPKARRRRVESESKYDSSSLPDDKDRLNLQIDKDLKVWVRDYARRKHTSLTQLITDYFVELKKEEEGDGVEQI